jgi:hypothetical protein
MDGDQIDSAATERRREQWRERKRRQRERQALTVIEPRDIAPSMPSPSVTFTRDMVTVQRDPIPFRIGRSLIGLVLIGAALMIAFTSMRANAWFGYALSVDHNAGQIFANLTVTAEVIAFFLPTANKLYRQMDERWTALRGWFMTIAASAVVFLAASGFVLTNVGDKTVMREQAMAKTPAVEAAQRALDDAKTARDRECVRVGPICRQREDTVSARQGELTEAMTKAGARAEVRANPQATALGIDPARLRTIQAGVLVTMCLIAGLVLSHGWGLVFRR